MKILLVIVLLVTMEWNYCNAATVKGNAYVTITLIVKDNYVCITFTTSVTLVTQTKV